MSDIVNVLEESKSISLLSQFRESRDRLVISSKIIKRKRSILLLTQQ